MFRKPPRYCWLMLSFSLMLLSCNTRMQLPNSRLNVVSPTPGPNLQRIVWVKGQAYMIASQRNAPANYRIQSDQVIVAPRGYLITIEDPSGHVLCQNQISDSQGHFQIPLDLVQAGIPAGSTAILFSTLRNSSNQALASAPLIIDADQETSTTSIDVQIGSLSTFLVLTARAASADHCDLVSVVQAAEQRLLDAGQRQTIQTMVNELLSATAAHPEQLDPLLGTPPPNATSTSVLDDARQSAASGAAQDQVATITAAVAIAADIIEHAPHANVLPTVPPATSSLEPSATPTIAPTATPSLEPSATPTVAPTATPTPSPTPTTGDVDVGIGIEDGPDVIYTPTPLPT